VTSPGLPLWTVIVILGGSIALSIATTLITLSLEQAHRARSAQEATISAQDTDPSIPMTTPDPDAGWSAPDVLDSHAGLAPSDRHRRARVHQWISSRL
jgi:hypothetical protein